LSGAVSKHVSAPVSFEVLEARPSRLESSPARMHRTWSDEAKSRIVAETLAPGAVVASIARAHDVAASQIYGWRRQALASGAVRPKDEAPVRFARFDAVVSGMVEIGIGEVTIRVGADVGEEQLARVIRAVRSA
jgi:transposase